jgi:hypothetical protein
MRLSNVVAATAALSLIAVPTIAAASPANPAAKLSLANKDVRAGAKAKDGNKLRGGGAGFLYAGLAIAVVVVAAVALGHNSDNKPASS